MKRKIFLLTLVLVLMFTTHVFATSNDAAEEPLDETKQKWTKQKVNKRLEKLGFTEEQIDALNWTSKVEIAKEKNAKKLLDFSSKSASFNEGTETDDSSTMGLTEDIDLNLVVIDLGTRNGNPYIKLVGDYDWNNMPSWRLHDAVALTWSEGWYGNSWSFTDEQYRCSGGAVCDYWYWDSTNHNNAQDEDRLAGVGWKYDLLSDAMGARGTTIAYLEANDRSLIQSTTYSAFKFYYAHDIGQSNIGVTIGLPKGAGVAAGVSFNGEEYTEDSTSIRNSNLSW
jgi:hypothetical protein